MILEMSKIRGRRAGLRIMWRDCEKLAVWERVCFGISLGVLVEGDVRGQRGSWSDG